MQELQGRKESLHALAFSADNRRVVVGGTSMRVDVWDLGQPAAKRPMFPKGPSTVAHLWVAPDGAEILAVDLGYGRVMRLGVDGSPLGHPFNPGVNHRAPPRFTPDGSGLIGGRVPTLWRFAAEPSQVWQAKMGPGFGETLAYGIRSDQGALAFAELIYTSSAYRVLVVPIGSPDPPRELASVPGYVRSIVWAPDGQHIAAAVETRVFVWYADGRVATVHQLVGRKHVADIAFHPSGRWLAVADNAGIVRLLDTATWAEARCFEWGLPKARCVCFSPDGTLAAVGSDTGRIVVWDVDG